MATQEASLAPPTGPKRPDRRRARWIFVLTAVAVLGLVAGLMVWAPWHQVPVPPAAVQAQSPTATSVRVSWAPSRGGATIDRYLVLRDGAQVGSVAASRTSYVDNGLAPGTTHRYTIIAASGTERSHPSVSAVVRTITPSPVGLPADQATWSTFVLHWSPPPYAPAPDQYLILNDGSTLDTLPGTTDSYAVTGLDPSATYTFQVVAVWGDHQSGPSPDINAATLAPPLQGDASIQVKILSTPGGSASLSPGQNWGDTWTLTPHCVANRCTLTLAGDWAPPNYAPVSWTMTLTGSGAGYAGTAKAPIAKCGSVSTTDTVTLSIAADNAAVDNGAWNSWHGTGVISMPYTDTSGGNYCPAQAWNFSVTG